MRKSFVHILVLIFLALCYSTQAQSLKDLLDKGDRFFNKKDYEGALAIYLEAIKLDPNDASANFRVGVCYLHGEKKGKAVAYLEKAYKTHPEVDADIDYHLGMAYQNDHQYARAIEHYKAFKKKNKSLTDIADHKISECEVGDSLTRKPAYAVVRNVGSVINSSFHEYSPLLSADGNTMIFTSNRSTDDYKIKSGTNYEDIYIAYRHDSIWSTPEKISPNINIKFNDAAASLSADSKTLFLYYEEGSGDIYTSTRQDDGTWTQPTSLNKNINTPLFWETSACLSADGKKLYFTSNRPGGRGELDIYVSELDANGNWGKGVNLGPAINTPGNEDSPFIHADGVTLYFSSDGHPTMGSNDIFKSEFVNGKWTKPVNLGYPVNSIEYDGFFTISPDKKTGYFSTTRDDGLGSADIYRVRFYDPPKEEPAPVVMASIEPVQAPPQEAPPSPPPAAEVKTDTAITEVAAVKPPEAPKPEVPKQEEPKKTEDFVDPIVKLHQDMKVVTVLKGKVIDEVSAAALTAVITLVDNETRKVITRMTSAANGDFELVIPHGGNYGVTTEMPGYLFNSINFNLPQFAEYQEIDTHILMVRAEVGSKVVLKNIFFDVGQSVLKPESIAELEKMRELLVGNKHLKVQINGHTDNTGNAAANMTLSLKRAEAVVQYLIEKGIEAGRVSAKGFGSEKPLVSNDDEQEGREINRRTEIEIIEAGQQG